MPFAYYGAKHEIASKYPRPRYPTIVEPFAGAAGYSCHHSALGRHVILNDADEGLIGLWHRLQTMTAADIDAVEVVAGGRTSDLLVLGSTSCRQFFAASKHGNDHAVTPRMEQAWRDFVRDRIKRVIPHVGEWSISCGDYRTLPDIEATWLIDPPYQPIRSVAGEPYNHGSSGIDYNELAEWCQTRRGQVIVCEQSPANWLPFTHLAVNGNGVGVARSEVVWLSDQQQGRLFDV